MVQRNGLVLHPSSDSFAERDITRKLSIRDI